MTEAEKKLWWHLKRLPTGPSHWRRQATIGPYFADFACHELRLILEVDGGQHANTGHVAADARRAAYLAAQGYRVLRFWNNEVLKNIDGVLISIARASMIDQTMPPTPDPSPPQAGGGE